MALFNGSNDPDDIDLTGNRNPAGGGGPGGVHDPGLGGSDASGAGGARVDGSGGSRPQDDPNAPNLDGWMHPGHVIYGRAPLDRASLAEGTWSREGDAQMSDTNTTLLSQKGTSPSRQTDPGTGGQLAQPATPVQLAPGPGVQGFYGRGFSPFGKGSW